MFLQKKIILLMQKIFTVKNIMLLLLIFMGQNIVAQYSEYEVKAQFITVFTKYVEWPENSAVNDKSVPFRISVIGKNPFGTILSDLSMGLKIKGKSVEYKEVNDSEFTKCDLLFIASSEKNSLEKIIAKTKGKGILIISDYNGFANAGVYINFYLKANKVHFEINLNSAELEGFKISSHLLKHARIVE
jgi:hypothetical protein